MELEIDSELHFRVKDADCEPIVFVPDVDVFELKDESIIKSF